MLRKVIRIRAEDSPSVALALQQIAQGIEPTNEEVIPGCINWEVYQYRRKTWDKVRQCVGLDGMFYEGAQLLLYPPEWLNLSEARADAINIKSRKKAQKVSRR